MVNIAIPRLSNIKSVLFIFSSRLKNRLVNSLKFYIPGILTCIRLMKPFVTLLKIKFFF